MYRRLRDLREDLDIFQSEIADFLHCTQSAYSKIEWGDREIPISFLIKLANFYNRFPVKLES